MQHYQVKYNDKLYDIHYSNNNFNTQTFNLVKLITNIFIHNHVIPALL